MSIATAFKNAARDFKKLNPGLGLLPHEKRLLGSSVNPEPGKLGNRRGQATMNKTEREYALILEAMKRRGEILRYEYEGITLRWQGIKYTPDFIVFYDRRTSPEWTVGIKLIEIKGAFTKGKFERAVERFRHARTYWPEFQFECWQKKKTGWEQIL